MARWKIMARGAARPQAHLAAFDGPGAGAEPSTPGGTGPPRFCHGVFVLCFRPPPAEAGWRPAPAPTSPSAKGRGGKSMNLSTLPFAKDGGRTRGPKGPAPPGDWIRRGYRDGCIPKSSGGARGSVSGCRALRRARVRRGTHTVHQPTPGARRFWGARDPPGLDGATSGAVEDGRGGPSGAGWRYTGDFR